VVTGDGGENLGKAWQFAKGKQERADGQEGNSEFREQEGERFAERF
jgi:hypothetical protein